MNQIFPITLVFILCFFNIKAQNLDVEFTGECYESYEIYYDGSKEQSFTSGLTGYLSKLEISLGVSYCSEATSINCMLSIFEGACSGTGSLLTSQPFVLSTINNTSKSMREIILDSPVTILSGQMYTIELSVPQYTTCHLILGGQTEARLFWYGVFQNEQTNCNGSYTDGNAYIGTCLPIDFDFYFKTYVSENLNTSEFEVNNLVKLYPNPSNNSIYISGLKQLESFTIYNMLGNKVSDGNVSNNEKIDIHNLNKGIYFLKFKNGNTLKFIKV